MHPERLIQLISRANILPQQSNSQSHRSKFIFPADEFAVRKTLVDMIAALQFLDYSREEYGSIQLVLAEAMNNIVEHACNDDPDGMIELEIVPTDNGIKCILRDNGQPMPDGNVPLGNHPNRNAGPTSAVNDLPEGGFGWFLIRDLTQDLQYTRQNGKNILTFRIATGPQHVRPN